MDLSRQRLSQQSSLLLENDDHQDEYDPFGTDYPILPPYDSQHQHSRDHNDIDFDDDFPQSPRPVSYAPSLAPLFPPPEYTPHPPTASPASPTSPTTTTLRSRFRPGQLMRRTFSAGNSDNPSRHATPQPPHSRQMQPSGSLVLSPSSTPPRRSQRYRQAPDPDWAAYVDRELRRIGL